MARWDGIEEFIAVGQEGSFTGAAEKLGTSKSYVSKQIRLLEQRLKAKLVNRTTRRLSLTETGQLFFEKCQHIAELYDQAEQDVSRLQDEPIGTLKIAINNTFGVHYMASAVAEYCRHYPRVNIEVTAIPGDADVVSEGYDLAVRFGDLEDSTLVAKKLGVHCFCLCATKEYFDAHGMPESIQDLQSHNCLTGRNRTWRFNDKDGHIKVRVNSTWVSDDGSTQLEAARQGIGLAQLPIPFIEDDLKSGRLLMVSGSWARYDRIAWVVYPQNRYLTPKLRTFIDFLTGSFIPALAHSGHMFIPENARTDNGQSRL